MLLTANWLDWYHVRHQERCFQSGTLFEDYVTDILAKHHDDFVNPATAGRLGDGGCDGLAESGSILYACYGQRPGRDAERELRAKLAADFARGSSNWDGFTIWRFVTNAPVGPLALAEFTALQNTHGPDSSRPLTMRIWGADRLWAEVVSGLSPTELNGLFPGVPGIHHLELADLTPLLDMLGGDDRAEDDAGHIDPVPPNKMDWNELPAASRVELNNGRIMAPRIDRWYAEAPDPTLRDAHGERFKTIYEEARAVVVGPAQVLERLYVALAGANFRMDAKRANAAYAVVSYFFDSCHIFEVPPVDLGDASVVTH